MELSTLSVVIILVAVVYLLKRHLYSYWDRRGVTSLPATFPFGNFGPTFLQKMSVGELIQEMYRSTTEPFIGIYSALRPTLLVRDTELIRHILIKDFQHFHDRGVHSDEKRDPLSAHLFALNGDQWKNLRVVRFLVYDLYITDLI